MPVDVAGIVAVPVVTRFSPPVPPISLAAVCATGGHFCRSCEAFRPATDGPRGGLVCSTCGAGRLDWVDPVPGYRERLEGLRLEDVA